MNTAGDVAREEVRGLASEERYDEAWALAREELLAGGSSTAWSTARNLLRTGAKAGWTPPHSRTIRLAVLCTYEPTELAESVRLACLALGIAAEVYVAPYGQVEQEVMAADSGLSRFGPTHVLIAASTHDLGFPELADDVDGLLAAAEQRWRRLWELIRADHDGRVLQHGFVVPDVTPLGHLSMRMAGSRVSLVRELNRRLAHAAGADVLMVDCERLASRHGKLRWEDPRLWYAARRPLSFDALSVLARETAAVLAGDVGVGVRCLIVDLDNTLWGGVVGEDGVDALAVGEGPVGEAFAAFQYYLRGLRERGVLLAVASKNDLRDAQEPFERRPEMRLKLEDFAAFVADWRRKPEQIAEIAERLGIGLDAIVFADDNPAECAEVASALPAVAVVRLDVPPSELVRKLASSVRFEVSSLSREDAARQRSYAARAKAADLRAEAASLEDFWRSLEMRARVRDLVSISLDRAAQLTQKTNQFNLTLRRRTREEIERLAADEAAICRSLELEDRFASHGVIGLGFAVASVAEPETAEIETLLLSCRVIGRTAEVHLLSHLSRAARVAGFRRLRGVYVPGPRNALVAELYPRLGFVNSRGNGNCWEYDLAAGPIESPYIVDVS